MSLEKTPPPRSRSGSKSRGGAGGKRKALPVSEEDSGEDEAKGETKDTLKKPEPKRRKPASKEPKGTRSDRFFYMHVA